MLDNFSSADYEVTGLDESTLIENVELYISGPTRPLAYEFNIIVQFASQTDTLWVRRIVQIDGSEKYSRLINNKVYSVHSNDSINLVMNLDYDTPHAIFVQSQGVREKVEFRTTLYD